MEELCLVSRKSIIATSKEINKKLKNRPMNSPKLEEAMTLRLTQESHQILAQYRLELMKKLRLSTMSMSSVVRWIVDNHINQKLDSYAE
jgi:hypothetical protein